ncbi:hypothetical protein JY440_09075 [Stenotrophomonas maltophilia]|uniref:hypothetical protein n=1 Tax=Stenotrophomonas maltophilia group TaxID=995085 RepID=UPI000AE7A7E4|nr:MULTISPECIES: hypothetical protein [Stenotrophomonas]MBH1542339.1 hypothetical protein [Stenotrophomonas maltophilia]MBN4983352.1 hypothetical protein [Stenotrophomonas maltophilia]MDZ7477463.1 hypothetical protein [Stenotrophomonas pavanii]
MSVSSWVSEIAQYDMGLLVVFGLVVGCVVVAVVWVGLELAWHALSAYWRLRNGR